MFSRKNHPKYSSLIPNEVLTTITDLINESFGKSFKEKNLTLESYGELYEDEIILVLSLSTASLENTISLFISDDFTQKDDLKEKINHLVSASSEFFEIFTNSSEDEILELYSPDWKKTELSKNNFFYKISRENIKLTIEANKILAGES